MKKTDFRVTFWLLQPKIKAAFQLLSEAASTSQEAVASSLRMFSGPLPELDDFHFGLLVFLVEKRLIDLSCLVC